MKSQNGGIFQAQTKKFETIKLDSQPHFYSELSTTYIYTSIVNIQFHSPMQVLIRVKVCK